MNRRVLLLLACLLTLLRLWLSRGQEVFAIGGAVIDDRLFVDLADSLLKGEWLGEYRPMTLAKGPFYSMWMAGAHLMGVPLRLSELLATVAASALVVLALAPVVKAHWQRFLIYVLLLCNPMSYEMPVLGRVLRQNIYVPLSLALLACALALAVRASEGFRRQAPWALGAGLLYSAFYLVREEGVWLAPCLLPLFLTSAWLAWRKTALRGLLTVSSAWGLALVLAILPLLWVSSMNAKHYGWFGTVEFRATEFKEAYGALLRVKQAQPIRRVPVTREAREKIYAVSPAFAELRPYLEGSFGQWAAGCSSPFIGVPPDRMEMAGGWFMWALRDSVAAAGHGKNAGSTLAYYARLAREVNEACDSGKLEAGPRRSGFLPPWREGFTGLLIKTYAEFYDYFVSFRGFTAYAPPSQGDEGSLQLFRRITGERLSADPYISQQSSESKVRLNQWKVHALQSLGKVMRKLLFWLILACHFLVIYRLYACLRARRIELLTLASILVLGSCCATVLINAMVDVTSFPTLSTGSFAQAYPFIILFCGLVIADVSQSARRTP